MLLFNTLLFIYRKLQYGKILHIRTYYVNMTFLIFILLFNSSTKRTSPRTTAAVHYISTIASKKDNIICIFNTLLNVTAVPNTNPVININIGLRVKLHLVNFYFNFSFGNISTELVRSQSCIL